MIKLQASPCLASSDSAVVIRHNAIAYVSSVCDAIERGYSSSARRMCVTSWTFESTRPSSSTCAIHANRCTHKIRCRKIRGDPGTDTGTVSLEAIVSALAQDCGKVNAGFQPRNPLIRNGGKPSDGLDRHGMTARQEPRPPNPSIMT